MQELPELSLRTSFVCHSDIDLSTSFGPARTALSLQPLEICVATRELLFRKPLLQADRSSPDPLGICLGSPGCERERGPAWTVGRLLCVRLRAKPVITVGSLFGTLALYGTGWVLVGNSIQTVQSRETDLRDS